MKTAAVLIIAIVAQAAGDVCLTKGMKALASLDATGGRQSESLSQIAHLALQAAQSPMVWAGTLLLIVFFALYSAALSWADLSFVLPATAFGYVLNVAAGYYFLNEAVSTRRWAGAVIITLGVLFVSRSGHRTVETRGDGLLIARGAE
ncbi:MAG TPA: EamA family transporter [Blastocatellia bacterium]|nr:EamA family transporter [Blastocatellia bacterium]